MAISTPAGDHIKKVFTSVAADSGQKILANPILRRQIMRGIERKLIADYKHQGPENLDQPGLWRDKLLMSLAIVGVGERAFAEHLLSPAVIRELSEVLVNGLFVKNGDEDAVQRFVEQYGQKPPSLLLISPGKACNLHCAGCYANSGDSGEKLTFETVSRIISEAKTMWGMRFFVFSGGEPFVWRSEGKGLIDIVEQNRDCFFMVYTNGTMIDDKTSKRLSDTGNLAPCISLEGFREKTDARRGPGMFDKVMEVMGRLRRDGVPIFTSLTATRENAEELLSPEFINMLIEQGVLLAWLFQYHPIGRAYTLEMMPTPEQRLWMWRRSWEVLRERKIIVADFWNQGTVVDGCLSAGGHDNGGYLYIDWNGSVAPCVFVPYAPVNINKIYADGGTLVDAWSDEFFVKLRQWQKEYFDKHGNQLAPCPYRDHHADLQRIVHECEPEPTDAGALAAMTDPEFTQGLIEYGQQVVNLTSEIWEEGYLHPDNPQDLTRHPSEELVKEQAKG